MKFNTTDYFAYKKNIVADLSLNAMSTDSLYDYINRYK